MNRNFFFFERPKMKQKIHEKMIRLKLVKETGVSEEQHHRHIYEYIELKQIHFCNVKNTLVEKMMGGCVH